MTIKYAKSFWKNYVKLTSKKQSKVKKTIALFQIDTHHPSLRNHPLQGDMQGRRSISAGGDLRLVFRDYEKYTVVLFLDVGSHNQVY